jgi:aminoglycoside phosphotransferase (APT) family kinase protein
MTQGVSTLVYRITRGDESFYLRILPEPDATFAPEVCVHQLALEMGCRVPEAIYYEPRDEHLDRSLILTTEISGEPLTSTVDPIIAREVVRAAGRDLARINSIPVDGFGWVTRGDAAVPERLAAEYPDVNTLLEAEFARAFDELPGDAVPAVSRTALIDAAGLAMRIVGDATQARLAHGDFDTSHIFVADGEYAGVIDFGEIRGTPPFYDLGHHRMHDRERLPYATSGWLLEGYRDIAPLPDDIEHRLSALSLLIAVRALERGLRHSSDSRIVWSARRAILHELAFLQTQTA